MDVVDAPQWLLPAFVRSVRAVGSTAPVDQIQATGENLIRAWSTPDRHFHNLRHVIDLLARVDELAEETHYPDVMRLATWYHGAVFSSCREQTYRRNGGEDEVASAVLAANDLKGLGVPDTTVDRVCQLILNLKRHNLPPKDMDAMALSDADLGTLAVEPQQYKKYRAQVYAEYAHLPVEDYLTARAAIVTKLLERDRLFSSPMGARWETAARENLAAELRGLQVKAAELKKGATLEQAAAAAARAFGGPATGTVAAVQEPGAEQPASRDAGAEPTGSSQPAPVPGVRPAAPEPAPAPAPAPEQPGAQAVERPSAPPPARTSRSAPSPATGEMPVVQAPQAATEPSRRARPAPRTPGERALSHATSMESCVEDLDQLLSSRREPLPGATGESAASRQAQVEAERARMQERLRRKVEEAKILREARTGEFAPVTEEVVDDSANLR